jgi:diaminopimelate decarboxylase
MSMASNYNSRNRPAELLVEGDTHNLIRERDRTEEQWANERLL